MHDDRKKPRKHRRALPRTLTAGDVRRIIHALDGATPATRSLVWLALHSGARVSELQRLRWNDIDPCARVIRFRGGKRGSYSVPLPPGLAAALTEWCADMPAGQPLFEIPSSRPVLTERYGRPLSTDAIIRLFARHATSACGRPVSMHELRRWLLLSRTRRPGLR
jgi:integrase